MSRILVTGATGVLGRRVVPLLVGAGHEVHAVARGDVRATQVRASGAQPVALDLFDPDAVHRAVRGHDIVVHLATHIPTSAASALRRSWRENDRLRREAAGHLAAAVVATGAGRYVQESITFPYVDSGDDRIDEAVPRVHSWGTETTADAEAAANSVSEAGGVGVTLRFAMFAARDSAHTATFVTAARRGWFAIPGPLEHRIAFVDADDAASAVVAATSAPAGVYNVAEADPRPRGDHLVALAAAVRRTSLRTVPMPAPLGGAAVAILTRSQRISSDRFTETTGWRPRVAVVDTWGSYA